MRQQRQDAARYPTTVVCKCRQRAERWTNKVENREQLRYVCTWCSVILDVDGKVVYQAGAADVKSAATPVRDVHLSRRLRARTLNSSKHRSQTRAWLVTSRVTVSATILTTQCALASGRATRTTSTLASWRSGLVWCDWLTTTR